jgi:hypothetical protein
VLSQEEVELNEKGEVSGKEREELGVEGRGIGRQDQIQIDTNKRQPG